MDTKTVGALGDTRSRPERTTKRRAGRSGLRTDPPRVHVPAFPRGDERRTPRGCATRWQGLGFVGLPVPGACRPGPGLILAVEPER